LRAPFFTKIPPRFCVITCIRTRTFFSKGHPAKLDDFVSCTEGAYVCVMLDSGRSSIPLALYVTTLKRLERATFDTATADPLIGSNPSDRSRAKVLLLLEQPPHARSRSQSQSLACRSWHMSQWPDLDQSQELSCRNPSCGRMNLHGTAAAQHAGTFFKLPQPGL
jgi:hypothetical protein